MSELTPERLAQIEKAASAYALPYWFPAAVLTREVGELIAPDAAEHIANMDPETTLALIARVRELEKELATLRDADQDANSRFAASPHLDAKWHPQLRRLMRERDAATSERHEAREELAETRRALKKAKALGEEA